MKYLSASETAEKWNVSKRWVVTLCGEGRIKDAQKAGNSWIIPENAERPTDARVKSGKYIKSKNEVTTNGCSN